MLISEGASGWLCGNTLKGHAKTELQVCDDGSVPLLDGNVISDSQAGGVLVFRGAGGTLRKNTITANTAANVRIADGSTARLEENTITGGHDCGVALCGGALAVLTDNTIKGHVKANVIVYGARTYPTLLRNVVEGSEQSGVYLYAASKATLEDNEIRGNVGPNVLVTEGADPLIHKCAIHASDDAGVLVHLEGKVCHLSLSPHGSPSHLLSHTSLSLSSPLRSSLAPLSSPPFHSLFSPHSPHLRSGHAQRLQRLQ